MPSSKIKKTQFGLDKSYNNEWVWVYYGPIDKIYDHLKRKKYMGAKDRQYRSAEAFAYYKDRTYGRFIIALPAPFTHECVYHECQHLAYYMLHHLGMKHDVDNHENLAYLQGHLVDKILDVLGLQIVVRKKNFKPKKTKEPKILADIKPAIFNSVVSGAKLKKPNRAKNNAQPIAAHAVGAAFNNYSLP